MNRNQSYKNLVGLTLSPVQGNFDANHLKEIHRRICQGEPDFSPGKFRPPVEPGEDRIKNRHLKSVNTDSFIAYSSMDESAIKELDAILERANPDRLKHLNTEKFTKEIADIYTRADYIHPFEDGNSRTLRTFTRQLANESGYHIDWEKFNQSDKTRDQLYIARDQAVREIGIERLNQDSHKHMLQFSLDQLGNNASMEDLLSTAIRPQRAIEWELSPADAVEKHPELDKAYALYREAQAYYAKELPGNPYAQQKALEAVNKKIQQSLDRGEVNSYEVAHSRKGPDKNTTPTEEKTRKQERDTPDRERKKQH